MPDYFSHNETDGESSYDDYVDQEEISNDEVEGSECGSNSDNEEQVGETDVAYLIAMHHVSELHLNT